MLLALAPGSALERLQVGGDAGAQPRTEGYGRRVQVRVAGAEAKVAGGRLAGHEIRATRHIISSPIPMDTNDAGSGTLDVGSWTPALLAVPV